MLKSLKIVSIFILLLVSCIKPSPTTQPNSSTAVEYTLNYRLIKITGTRWTNDEINVRVYWMKKAFEPVGLDINQLPTEELNKPEWVTIESHELASVFAFCRSKNEVNHEEVVVLTNKLMLADGKEYGGCANYSNNRTIASRYGTIWSRHSEITIGFHELAHRLSLPHSDPKVPCDAMSYFAILPGRNNCEKVFLDTQIQQMKKWITEPVIGNCLTYRTVQPLGIKPHLKYDKSELAE